ncbi:nitrilase-related carbon-nitrogen hydrolase [Bacteroides sp.]|uniref:nitrilase-related carbon-nitrogen hydrolase n=1 Tax=Bacteroides sp. TaxID=29523 RepID=UPI00261004F0|nr:nitrilase-related carbon-nitrogen hydrolase [Bacteroides sp.]
MISYRFILFWVVLSIVFPIQAQDTVVADQCDVALCRVALVQPHLAWGNVKANLSAFEKRVQQCRDCDVIVFPELFTSGCEMKQKNKEEAISSKDKVASYYSATIKKMKKWAKQSDALVIGSTIYKEAGKYYNRLLAVFPNGEYQYYDKHNCFKKGAFSPGDKQLVLNWRGRRFATYICYDLRFPEWSRNNDRYDTAIYIANWPASRSEDWNRLLSERAVENKAYVIAVNCAGTDLAGIDYVGGSTLIAPNGEVQIKCKDFKEDIVIVEY